MALKLDGTTGCLEHSAKIVSAFPFSMMMWVAHDATTEQDAVTIFERPHGNAKLTKEDAAKIRSMYPGTSSIKLAAMYNVSKRSILNILHNKTFAR